MKKKIGEPKCDDWVTNSGNSDAKCHGNGVLWRIKRVMKNDSICDTCVYKKKS